MKVTYLGHASLLLETQHANIIVDPFITGNELAKHIDVNTLKAEYIFLTHAHQDHILDAEKIAKNNDATIISSFEIANYFAAKECKVGYLNVGGNADFNFGKVFGTIAVHSSSFEDGSYGGLAQGFVFEADGKRIYISGDTALTYDMKLIPETIGSIDLAIFPIGNTFTMGYKEAILASDFVQCNKVLGTHYDTFPPIQIDKEEAKKAFEQNHKELVLIEIGEKVEV